jgi:ADP-ribosylglycohydrolase
LSGIDYQHCDLFTDRCVFTDDTILSLATKMAVLGNRDFAECYRSLAREYVYVGYGTGFHKWIRAKEAQPFYSCGNGSAMRISFIADYFADLTVMQQRVKESALCTHNHPEGIKGAIVAATCMWMAKHGASKEEIYRYAVKAYPVSQYEFGTERALNDYRDIYKFDATCQGSIPVAIRCFIESDDYESCLRNAYSLNCDLDTVCCVGGAIAENYYGKTGFPNHALLSYYLDEYLLSILYR